MKAKGSILYDLLSLLWSPLLFLFLGVRLVKFGDSDSCMMGMIYVQVEHWAVGVGCEEICVELHLLRDCAHYPWVPGDACSYLPIMPKISKEGREGMGPRQVEFPQPLAGSCKG